MATQTPDPDSTRRTQRRRAVIGWGGALIVIAVVVLGIVLGSGSGGSSRDVEAEHARIAKIPYGETMTSGQFGAIEPGESEADVLEGLGATGRPEKRTLPFVLILFPAPPSGEFCTYWEFSDEPEVFARLCFDDESGELSSKLDGNVGGARKVPGTVI
jgi:hypothetical protein